MFEAAPVLFSPNIKYLNPPDVAVDTGRRWFATLCSHTSLVGRLCPGNYQHKSDLEERKMCVTTLNNLLMSWKCFNSGVGTNQCSILAFEFNMTASLEPALPGPGHHAAPGGLCLVVEMFQQDAAPAGEAEELTRGLLPTLGLTLLPLLRTEHHNLSRLYLLSTSQKIHGRDYFLCELFKVSSLDIVLSPASARYKIPFSSQWWEAPRDQT